MFESSPKLYDDSKLALIQVEGLENFYKLHQSRYTTKVEIHHPCADYDTFRLLRHNLEWLAHTLPDIVAPVNILSQVT